VNENFQTITLPYDCKAAREIVHAMIAGLVERGIGFAASYSAGNIVIRCNGGF
jgi:hypothetical protein